VRNRERITETSRSCQGRLPFQVAQVAVSSTASQRVKHAAARCGRGDDPLDALAQVVLDPLHPIDELDRNRTVRGRSSLIVCSSSAGL
jgi:hypothetical protein